MHQDSDTAPVNSTDAKIDQLLELTTLDDPDFNQTLSGGDYGDCPSDTHEFINLEDRADEIQVDVAGYDLAAQAPPLVIGMMVLTLPLPDPREGHLQAGNRVPQGIDLLSCRS
jgi:hypothetical protein